MSTLFDRIREMQTNAAAAAKNLDVANTGANETQKRVVTGIGGLMIQVGELQQQLTGLTNQNPAAVAPNSAPTTPAPANPTATPQTQPQAQPVVPPTVATTQAVTPNPAANPAPAQPAPASPAAPTTPVVAVAGRGEDEVIPNDPPTLNAELVTICTQMGAQYRSDLGDKIQVQLQRKGQMLTRRNCRAYLKFNEVHQALKQRLGLSPQARLSPIVFSQLDLAAHAVVNAGLNGNGPWDNSAAQQERTEQVNRLEALNRSTAGGGNPAPATPAAAPAPTTTPAAPVATPAALTTGTMVSPTAQAISEPQLRAIIASKLYNIPEDATGGQVASLSRSLVDNVQQEVEAGTPGQERQIVGSYVDGLLAGNRDTIARDSRLGYADYTSVVDTGTRQAIAMLAISMAVQGATLSNPAIETQFNAQIANGSIKPRS